MWLKSHEGVQVLLHMTAGGRHEQNIFQLLEAPQTLYIMLIIKVTDQVQMKIIYKNLLTNVMLVQYKLPDGTISGSQAAYDKYLKKPGSPVLSL